MYWPVVITAVLTTGINFIFNVLLKNWMESRLKAEKATKTQERDMRVEFSVVDERRVSATNFLLLRIVDGIRNFEKDPKNSPYWNGETHAAYEKLRDVNEDRRLLRNKYNAYHKETGGL